MGLDIQERLRPLPARSWIAANLEKIKIDTPEHFSFAVFGDIRSRNPKFGNLLKLIDHDPEIAFAMVLGDFIEQGTKEAYRHFLRQARSHLGIPLLTAMGGNELRGKGRRLYSEILGPPRYSFRIGKTYFVVLDNARRAEIDGAQRRWIEEELSKATAFDRRIVFLHVPLYDPDGGKLGRCLPEASARTLAGLFKKYRVTHVFASYINGYFEGQWMGIPYTITGGAGAKLPGDAPDSYFSHFLKVKIKKGSYRIQVKLAPPPDLGWPASIHRVLQKAYTFFRSNGMVLAFLLIVGGFLIGLRGSPPQEESESSLLNGL
jgi:hypothetical protein